MKKNYYYFIDLLRWFAAMGVLLHHYAAHFKVNEISNSDFFNYFIKNSIIGSYGVWLFWCISGFVFTSIYVNNKDTLVQFSIKRFARLYPLHFATLIIVAILQYYSLKEFNHFQINDQNNFFRFILNLFFINDENSFNSVIWSVSIEIPVYFIFFFYLRLINNNILIKTVILVIVLWFILRSGFLYYHLSACLFYFFFGVLIYLLCNLVKKLSFYLLIVSSTGIIITPLMFEIKNSLSFNEYRNYIPTTLFLFFVLLTLFFSLEKYFHKFGEKIKFLGDSSYAIYLIHFPIQVFILILNDLKIINIELFSSYEYLVVFFIIINYLSYLVFKLFEYPARKGLVIFLQKKLI